MSITRPWLRSRPNEEVAEHGSTLDSQDRTDFEDIDFLFVYAIGKLLQKPWLPLTADVRLT